VGKESQIVVEIRNKEIHYIAGRGEINDGATIAI